MNKIFLDASIILDFLDADRKFHNYATELFNILINYNYSVCFSEDILTTVFYISKNKQSTLRFFNKIIKLWNVVPFGQDAIQEGINLCLKEKVDLEDVLQCLCAKYNGCNILITNDRKFYNCGIEIMTSKEFIERTKATT